MKFIIFFVVIVAVIVICNKQKEKKRAAEKKEKEARVFEMAKPKRTKALLAFFAEFGIVPKSECNSTLMVDPSCLRLFKSQAFCDVLESLGELESFGGNEGYESGDDINNLGRRLARARQIDEKTAIYEKIATELLGTLVYRDSDSMQFVQDIFKKWDDEKLRDFAMKQCNSCKMKYDCLVKEDNNGYCPNYI